VKSQGSQNILGEKQGWNSQIIMGAEERTNDNEYSQKSSSSDVNMD